MPKKRTFASKQIKKNDDHALTGDFGTPSKTLAPPPMALGSSSGSGAASGAGGGSSQPKPVSVPVPMPQEEVDPDIFTQAPPEGEQLPTELEEAAKAFDAHIDGGGDPGVFTGFKEAAQKLGTENGEQQEKEDGELTPEIPGSEIEKAGEGGGDGGPGDGEGGGEGEGAANGGEGTGGEGGTEGGAPNMGDAGGEGGEGAGGGGDSAGSLGSGGGAASPPQGQTVQGSFGAGTEPSFSIINEAAKEGMGSVEVVQTVGDGKYLILGGGGNGGAGGGAPIQKQEDPDQEEPQNVQVPQGITTQSLEEDRAKCQALVNEFQANATSELGQLTTFKSKVAGEMQQWAEKGKAKVTENLQNEKAKVRASYGDAKMKVLGESVKALGEARRIRIEAEKKIKTGARTQRKAIQEAASTNLLALNSAAPTLITSLNAAIVKGKKGIADAAKAKGDAAKAAAESAAQGYLGETPKKMSWGEKLRYGPGYEKRKLKAKAEAARSVGDGFAKSFQQTAQEQSQGLESGKGELTEHIRKSIKQAKKAIKDGQKQALKSIAEAEKSGIKSVKATYDQKVEAGKSKLKETRSQLDSKKASDLAQLDSVAQQKKAAIDSQAGTMTTQMEGSVQSSIDTLSQQISSVAQQAGQYPVPDPDSLSTNLQGALGKVQAGITAAQAQLTEGIAAAGSSLEQMGASSSTELGAISTSAETAAQGLVDGAIAAFTALTTELETSANETADQISTGLGEMTTKITGFMGDLTEQNTTGLETMVKNTEAKMAENTKGMQIDFQNGIDTQLQPKIEAEAKKAAENVPSMWAVAFSWAVKILVAIAITAVCCALIASGVGLLAVVLVGAAMGAVGGALTYGTDCALGMQEFSWGGLGMSMATGAISGAVTALGAGAGAAFTSKVFGEAAKMTVGQQVASYAAETVIGFGIDSMGSGITNMINEGSFSPGAFWRGVQKDAVQNFAGNAIGGLIGMKLSKSPRFNSFMDSMQNTRFVQGVKDIDARVFGTGGATPKLDVPSGSGPEVSTTSAPETTAPTTNSGPEVGSGPEVKAPEVTAPEAKAPETTAPETSAPEVKGPETSAPEAKGPETTAPETSAPETKAPETTAPETSAPEAKAPETTAPETSAPEVKAPETTPPPQTAAPETKAPEVPTNQAPETKGPEVPTNQAPETKGPEVQGNDGPEVKGPEAEGGNVTNAQTPTKGADLAEELGYPKAPEGYHWANKDGVPIIRRNPGNAASGEYPQLRYDAETGTLRNVETGQPVTNVGEVDANGRLKNGPTGAKSDYVDQNFDPKTAEFYEKIAQTVDESDVAAISRNTGIPEPIVQRVKDHLFRKVQKIQVMDDVGNVSWVEGKFSPDEGIARSWKQAMETDLKAEDLVGDLTEFKSLISHEYVESNLMGDGFDYLNPNSWREHEIYGSGNYPKPADAGYGAHNLAPVPHASTAAAKENPFLHYPREHGFDYDGPAIKDNLSNLDEVINYILGFAK